MPAFILIWAFVRVAEWTVWKCVCAMLQRSLNSG
jgi:hypothetical protein